MTAIGLSTRAALQPIGSNGLVDFQLAWPPNIQQCQAHLS